MPVIVDGHNLLWSIHKTYADIGTITEIHLCRVLSKYLQLTRENGQIVFDGIGPRDKDHFQTISNVEVLFAGPNIDADTVIENKIKANTAPKRLKVISSDRRLRSAARARKALSVKSDVFWNQVVSCLRNKAKTRPQEPLAKRHGLTESETDWWLEYFGFEP